MRQLKISPTITNRDERSFERYLVDVNATPPPMTPDAEFEAGTMVNSGDPEKVLIGSKRLIMANLRFVVSVAKQYKIATTNFSTNDLIQYGNEGLIKAASKFDPTRGFKFISYAVWWIRQRILQAIAEEGKVVRLPLNQTQRLHKANQAKAHLQQIFGRDPSDEEIAVELIKRAITHQLTTKMGLDELSPDFESHMAVEFEKEYKRIDKTTQALTHLQSAGARTYSLDAPVNNESPDITHVDTISSSAYDVFEDMMQQRDVKIRLNSYLARIPQQDREILTMFYGLDGKGQRTLSEIGIKYELSGERVRQIKEKSIRRLKHNTRFRQDMKQQLAQ